MKHHYPNCDLGDRCNCQEIDDIEQELEHNMNEEQIKSLIASIYKFTKEELERSEAKLAETPVDSAEWQLENYMTGYHKGRFRMIEHIQKSIWPTKWI